MEEGEKRFSTQVCKRRVCEICGEVATHQLTFLLPNARRNPASRGYGKDDISWCSDDKMFVCNDCEKAKYDIAKGKGMEWCADFPYGERFKHLFLYWKEESDGQDN